LPRRVLKQGVEVAGVCHSLGRGPNLCSVSTGVTYVHQSYICIRTVDARLGKTGSPYPK
jgi:hypothetical protein